MTVKEWLSEDHVSDVVFPCGQTIGADGDTVNLYYGAADSCMALATGSIRSMLEWLDAHSDESNVLKSGIKGGK